MTQFFLIFLFISSIIEDYPSITPVLKSTVAERPCRRVTVTNCILSGTPTALKLGTESQGGDEDICLQNEIHLSKAGYRSVRKNVSPVRIYEIAGLPQRI